MGWKLQTKIGEHSVSTVDLSGIPGGEAAFVKVVDALTTTNVGRYETMVFKGDVTKTDCDFKELDCERYSTKEDAIAGHAAMVEKWKNGQPEAPA